MCTAPNFVYLTGVDDTPQVKYKLKKRVSHLPDTDIEVVNYDLERDGLKSIYHYNFIPHGSYDRIMKDDPTAIKRLIPVPCGKCLECRIQYARTWADRCALEAKKYKFNYFITLTYDDDHIPAYGSLRPRDMTLFIKRVRKKYGEGIKFLYAGEYGTSSLRPHYHIIFFNLPITDLSFDFVSYEGGQPSKHSFNHSKNLMYSESIHKLWYDENDHSILGNVSIAPFSYDTAAYVSQYVTKKVGNDLDSFYRENNLLPEFIRMSKGIAADVIDDEYFDSFDNIAIPGDGHIASLSRYFQKQYLKTHEVLSPEKLGRRHLKQKYRIDNYLHLRNFDHQASIRDYKLKKSQKIRNSI